MERAHASPPGHARSGPPGCPFGPITLPSFPPHALTRALEVESGAWPVLGPAPASIYRIQKDFRWEVLVKCDRHLRIEARVDWLERVFRRYQTYRPAGAGSVRIHTALAR